MQFCVFMEGIDLFDCKALGMSPLEAVITDPQQRLLLETNCEALLRRNQSISFFNGRDIGTYVGISTDDYAEMTKAEKIPISSFSMTAASSSYASGRIGFTFGLQGPTASIDTACSGSLVAAHMALLAFRQSYIEGALVSGVLLCLIPETFSMLAQSGLLSDEGRCKTFDAKADGYVRSESCRTIFLEPIQSLITGHSGDDDILGILVGSYVNSNARTASLIAPSGQAQQSLLHAALKTADLTPAVIDVLQSHANGTSLGDPVEIGAIRSVLIPNKLIRQSPLMISTVKGYGGHQEAGAGAVGLLEAASLASNSSIGSALHLRSLNPHVASALGETNAAFARGGPFGIPSSRNFGPSLNVGISSFGANGTNAHAILSTWSAKDGQRNLPLVCDIAKTAQWKPQRFWTTPMFQVLVSAAALRQPSVAPPSVAVLQSNLLSPRVSYLWEYSIHGIKHLSISALLAMCASTMPILNGNGDMKGDLGVLKHCAAIAPLPLPSWTRAKSSPNIVSVTMGVEYMDGIFEAAFGRVRVLSARFEISESERYLIDPNTSNNAIKSLQEPMHVARNAQHIMKGQQTRKSMSKAMAETVALGSPKVSGYVVHPVHLECTLSKQALFYMKRICAASWVKSIGAVGLSKWEASCHAGATLTNYRPVGFEIAGGADFIIPTLLGERERYNHFSLHEVRIQEHDLPSVHPKLEDVPAGHFMSVTFEFEAGVMAAVKDGHSIEKDIGKRSTEDPLRRMTDEELSRHLTRIVSDEVQAVVGLNVRVEEPLMIAGMDSRGGMELRRSIAAATKLPLPVTMLYDYPTIGDIVGFLSKLIRRQNLQNVEKAAEGINLMPGPVLGKMIHAEGEQRKVDDEEANFELDGGQVVPAKGISNKKMNGNAVDLMQEESEEDWNKPALPESFNIVEWRAETPPDPDAVRDKPSELLKVLRPPPRQRPLFLASPLGNTAQAAYFAFVSRYLEVSSQTLMKIVQISTLSTKKD